MSGKRYEQTDKPNENEYAAILRHAREIGAVIEQKIGKPTTPRARRSG